MKSFLKLLYCLTYLFISNILYCDGPGTTKSFSPNLMNGIIGLQYIAYNSANNQFLLTWLDNTSSVNCGVYDINGTLVSSQKTIYSGSSGSPFPCYNSVDNQYLVTWIAGGISFSILDDSGNTLIGPNTITLDPDLALYSNNFCCYNSIENQYCITWIAQNNLTFISNLYFVIVNADGTIAKDVTVIPAASGQITADYTDPFVTYNPKENQYLFTWQNYDGTTTRTTLAIYDAQGNSVVPAKIIPQSPATLNTSSYPIFSCYNVTNNQYFITWLGFDGTIGYLKLYFAIYDHHGSQIIPPTAYDDSPSSYSVPVCSYNGRNNQYFISWNEDNNPLCCIIDSQGKIVLSKQAIPVTTPQQPGDTSNVYNSFSVEDDKFFLTWYTSTNICAYYNIYTLTPTPITITKFTTTPKVILDGETSTLSAAIEGGFQPYTATWSDGTIVNNINSLKTTHKVSPELTTTYYVTINDNYNQNARSKNITVVVNPPPPTNLTGTRYFNRFANYGEYAIILKWNPSTSTNVVSYNIYKDSTLIATVPASTHSFLVHNQPFNSTTYSVEAINSAGNTSSKISITL